MADSVPSVGEALLHPLHIAWPLACVVVLFVALVLLVAYEHPKFTFVTCAFAASTALFVYGLLYLNGSCVSPFAMIVGSALLTATLSFPVLAATRSASFAVKSFPWAMLYAAMFAWNWVDIECVPTSPLYGPVYIGRPV